MNTKRINYSEIPPLTKAWFRKARHPTPEEVEAGRKAIEAKLGVSRPRRVGRPHKYSDVRLRDIHIKLHPSIVGWAKREAKKRHMGYQSFLNDFLLHHASAA